MKGFPGTVIENSGHTSEYVANGQPWPETFDSQIIQDVKHCIGCSVIVTNHNWRRDGHVLCQNCSTYRAPHVPHRPPNRNPKTKPPAVSLTFF